MSSSSARFRILAAAALLSTAGAAIKTVGLSSWQIAGLRSAFAIVGLLLLIRGGPGSWSWRSAVVGTAYALNMILFVAANKLTTAANAIYLQSAAPLYVLLLSPWLLGERVRSRDLGFMAVLAVGMILFFIDPGPTYATAPNPAFGNVVAVVGGVAWALTLIGLRWIGTGSDAGGPARAALIAGNVITILICLPLGGPPTTQATDWLVVAYLGMVQVGLSYALLTSALPHVPALEASLLLLLEPVFNPAWAWLLHGERPGGWALTGGVTILAAVTIQAVRGRSASEGP